MTAEETSERIRQITIARLLRERDEARHERDEALAEVERLKAAEIAGREILLPMKREQAQRFAKEIEKEARAKAIDEAAAVTDGLILAGDYSIMKAHILSNAKAAILALKEKP